jgi:integrase
MPSLIVRAGAAAKKRFLEFFKEWLQEYIEAAGLAEDPNGPLYRSVDRKTKQLGANRLDRQRAWAMVKRRAKKAGIETPGICNHTSRGKGITAYLENPEAKLEHAQQMAAHSAPKTRTSTTGVATRSPSMRSSGSGSETPPAPFGN